MAAETVIWKGYGEAPGFSLARDATQIHNIHLHALTQPCMELIKRCSQL